jgi:hypothetical protein
LQNDVLSIENRFYHADLFILFFFFVMAWVDFLCWELKDV